MDLAGRIKERGPRNAAVPKGLAGADVLGLRMTENSHEITLRDEGTVAEREERIREHLGLDSELDGVTTMLDDSWEDETGFVRSKARKFTSKGVKHDPSAPSPGSSHCRPSLPLLYTHRYCKYWGSARAVPGQCSRAVLGQC